MSRAYIKGCGGSVRITYGSWDDDPALLIQTDKASILLKS